MSDIFKQMSIMNEINLQNENIFIMYDDVISSRNFFTIKMIRDKYLNVYKDFIDTNRIKNMNDTELMMLCIERKYYNILEYLAIKEFDYKRAMDDVIKNNIFTEPNEILEIGHVVNRMRNQSFVNNIFIYTEEYDAEAHFTIQKEFGGIGEENSIYLVHGDFIPTINMLEEKYGKITTFMINDIDKIIPLDFNNKLISSSILIPVYGYNYILDENNEYQLRINIDNYMTDDTYFQYGIFVPYKLKSDD